MAIHIKVPTELNVDPALLTSDHSAIGEIFPAVAGEDLVFGEAVYRKSDSKYWEADADATTTMPAVALAIATISADATGDFLGRGFARDDTWTWTVGGDIYADTATGALTQTAPSGSADVVQKVGYAYSADIAYLDFTKAMVVIA